MYECNFIFFRLTCLLKIVPESYCTLNKVGLMVKNTRTQLISRFDSCELIGAPPHVVKQAEGSENICSITIHEA